MRPNVQRPFDPIVVSEQSAFITGEFIGVNGGVYAHHPAYTSVMALGKQAQAIKQPRAPSLPPESSS